MHLLKQMVPPAIRGAVRRYRIARTLDRNRSRTPKEVFTQIYETGVWGTPGASSGGQPYSGPGSEDAYTTPYAEVVRKIALDAGVRRIVDLGCGDFRVGRFIAAKPFEYVGVDVVEPVIAHNARHFAAEHIRFECKDIITDDLPDGDLCLIREVFQHMSNRQIGVMLSRTRRYPLLIVSENQATDTRNVRVNRDRPHGAVSRAFLGSALALDRPPFNLASVETIAEIAAPTTGLSGTTIRSFLIRN